jgi:hypothetical protein
MYPFGRNPGRAFVRAKGVALSDPQAGGVKAGKRLEAQMVSAPPATASRLREGGARAARSRPQTRYWAGVLNPETLRSAVEKSASR